MEHTCHTAYKSFTGTQDDVLIVENVYNLWFSFLIVEIILFQFYFQVNSIKICTAILKIKFSNNSISDFFGWLFHIIPPLFPLFVLFLPSLFASSCISLFSFILRIRTNILKSMFMIKSSLYKLPTHVFSEKTPLAAIYHTLIGYWYNLHS